MADIRYIYCRDLVEKGIVTAKDYGGCCTSCHEDADEFNYAMCSIKGAAERNAEGEVCCALGNYLTEHPLTEEQWQKLLQSQ